MQRTNNTDPLPIDIALGNLVAELQRKHGSRPTAMKLHPLDIAALQLTLIDRADVAVAKVPIAVPADAAMTFLGLPVYPDADVPRGEPRWVYAADEVP